MKPKTAIIFVGVLAGVTLLVATVVAMQNAAIPDKPAAETERQDFFSALFPFGNSGNPERDTPGIPGSQNGEGRDVPRLREVSSSPVAGARLTSDGVIRFVEQGTGHVFETRTDSFTTVRLSNTTIPDVYEALWVNDLSFIIRSLSDDDAVKTSYGSLNGTSTDQSIALVPVNGYRRIVPAGIGSSAIAVLENINGSRIERIDLTKKTPAQTLFVSPITSWVPVVSSNEVFLQTAPTDTAVGFLYRLDDQSLSRVMPGAVGLSASVNPSGEYVLFSSRSGNVVTLSLFDRARNETNHVSLSTFADKCTWVGNTEPLVLCAVPQDGVVGSIDDWMLGIQTYADDLWVIDPISNTASFLGTLTDESGEGIDATDLEVSSSGYVIFINKKNGSLWSFKVADEE